MVTKKQGLQFWLDLEYPKNVLNKRKQKNYCAVST